MSDSLVSHGSGLPAEHLGPSSVERAKSREQRIGMNGTKLPDSVPHTSPIFLRRMERQRRVVPTDLPAEMMCFVEALEGESRIWPNPKPIDTAPRHQDGRNGLAARNDAPG